MAERDLSAAAPGTAPPTPRRRHRRWFIVAAIVVAGLGGLAAFAAYGPQAIARYVADKVLTGLSIDVEGVKTLRINLFKGELSLGPVRFRFLGDDTTPAAQDAGQVGQLIVDLSLKTLWERNALIRAAAISGIDIVVSRGTDGRIAINGIPLERILAAEAEDKPRPETEKGGWGTGVDLLHVRDSRLVFDDASRGSLEITVSYLELDGFRSWEPDDPGTFTLIGDANGIGIVAWGQAQPFADNVQLRVETTIEGIAVAKIEAFTGPLPLTARDGSARIALRSRATLFADGRLDAATTGSIDVSGVTIAGDGWRFGAQDGRLGLDLAFDGETYASGRVTGSIDLGLGGVASGAGDDLAIGAAGLSVNTSALTIDLAEDGGLRAEMAATTSVQGITVTGTEGLAVNTATLKVTAQPVSLAFAVDGSGRVGAGVAAAMGEVRVQTGTGAEKLDITLARLASQLAEAGFDLTADGAISGQAQLTAAANGIAVDGADGLAVKTAALTLATQPLAVSVAADGTAKVTASPKLTLTDIGVQGPATASIAGVDLVLDPVSIDAGEAMAVRTAGRLSARTASVAGDAFSTSLADLGIAFANVTVEQKGERTKLTGDVKATLGSPGIGIVSTSAGPRARSEQIRVDARTLAIDAAPAAVNVAPEGVGIEGKASVRLDDTRVTLPDAAGGPASMTLARLAIALDRAKGRLGDSGSEASGDLKVELGDGAAQLGMIHPDARSGFGAFTVSLAPLDVRQDTKSWQVKSRGRVGLDRASARLPESELGPLDSALRSLTVAIANVEASSRGDALDWRIAADLALRDIATKVAGGRIADVQSERLTIDTFNGDDSLAFSAGRIGLGALRASLTRQKSRQAPQPVREAAEFVAETRQEIVRADQRREGIASFRLDRFRLDAPSQIRLSDANVEPPLRSAIVVSRLDIDNLDTASTSAKTDIVLAATVNEFGKIDASGWLTPFAEVPDFDLRAEVRGLQLPAFSGYAADAVGANIDQGQLRAYLTGAAAAGQLNANVDLTVADLKFGGLSQEQAARASAAIGVPIETAVGLLKDNEGKINLSLPVSGDLKSPSFDFSGVIAKAVTGAVTSAVMAPFKLAFAPVSLLAGAVSAGSAPSLAPVPFDAGSADLTPQADGIIRGLVQVLKERSGLTLKVCGRATQADLAVLTARLPDRAKLTTDQILERARSEAQELAGERTLAVRRAIVESGGIAATRIGECRATFDAADRGPPRTEITL